uniref:Glycosyltransferase family 25 n=1 Tax=Pithovirus LCPAC101 TaxID=2506586 RepID=A0A481Z1X7_9VIRU|nr:MAG: glycosyltransferase family 25 [Pithovirus LCPAC101]
MPRKFVVYILTDDEYKSEVEELYRIFDKHYFVVHTITLPYQLYKSNDDTVTEKDYNEIYRFDNSLLKSKKKYNSMYTIVIKDTSKIQISKDDLYDTLNNAAKYNEKKSEWDICYLCRWLDRCDLCTPVKNTSTNLSLLETYSPHGVQALMFSPAGRNRCLGIDPMHTGEYFTPVDVPLDTKLNADIEYGSLKAITYSSNIFQYDAKHAYRDSDYVKYSICRIPEEEEVETYSVWLYIIIIVVVLILLFIYHKLSQYMSRARPMNRNNRRYNNLNNNKYYRTSSK